MKTQKLRTFISRCEDDAKTGVLKLFTRLIFTMTVVVISLLNEAYGVTPSRSAFVQFVENLNERRTIVSSGLSVLSLQVASPGGFGAFCAKQLGRAAGWQAGGGGFLNPAELNQGEEEWLERRNSDNLEPCVRETSNNTIAVTFATAQADATRVSDPQHALLLDVARFNGLDVFDRLFDKAVLPQNVVLEAHLPDFLGGAMFIATRAFSGAVFDQNNNEIPHSAVGFGVFVTDKGSKFLSVITFVQSAVDITNIETTELDFSSALEGSGLFEAEGIQLLTTDIDLVLNRFLTLKAVQSTFNSTLDSLGCPNGFVGKFNFTAKLTNVGMVPLFLLRITVRSLTNKNLLQNADGGPAGVDGFMSIPIDVLNSGESIDIPLSICLKQFEPFNFTVDVRGLRDVQ